MSPEAKSKVIRRRIEALYTKINQLNAHDVEAVKAYLSMIAALEEKS
jgi:hypothetical protein